MKYGIDISYLFYLQCYRKYEVEKIVSIDLEKYLGRSEYEGHNIQPCTFIVHSYNRVFSALPTKICVVQGYPGMLGDCR